jgi:hypothetical protein
MSSANGCGFSITVATRTDELETLEHNIAAAVQRNKLLTTKQSSGFIKRSAASGSCGRIA